jgi:ABC-type sugar transport system ATPase subunit
VDLQENNVILKMENISKSFPGVKALDGVNFELRKGEVHALLGENGSGKSTLIKCLGGIYIAEEGDIYLNGKKVTIKDVHDSQNLGISIVHQELALANYMTVAENMYMGREPLNKMGLVDFKELNSQARKVLKEFGDDIRPTLKVERLSIACQQVVEIAKALTVNAQIVVMDEPTASLSQEEVDKLFKTVKMLKEKEISIIYISHRMEELFILADRVTVFKDGTYVGTKEIKDTNEDDLVKMMVGRDIKMHYASHQVSDEVLLEVKDLCREGVVNNVNMKVRKGEVVGISGLVGSGRSEFAKIIAGIDKKSSGQIFLNGKELDIKSPLDAIRSGIVLCPESRKTEGLVMIQTVGFNITLSVLKEFIKSVGVNRKREKAIIDEYFKKLNIKASSSLQKVNKLSGGNQQKVVLAKWLAMQPKILILDEPTRGIDVGAKAEIYSLIDELAKENVGIIVISSELPEIMRISDTVQVMHSGQFVAEFSKHELDEEKIARFMTGVEKNEK